MKVERLAKIKEFEPITLNLIIETKEELEALRCICDYNVTIPNMVKNRAFEIKTFLDSLKRQIN